MTSPRSNDSDHGQNAEKDAEWGVPPPGSNRFVIAISWGLFVSLLLGGCVGIPLGVALGNVIGDWFVPGASARPHAFEEPPTILGDFGGFVVLAIIGAILTAAVIRRKDRNA